MKKIYTSRVRRLPRRRQTHETTLSTEPCLSPATAQKYLKMFLRDVRAVVDGSETYVLTRSAVSHGTPSTMQWNSTTMKHRRTHEQL